MAFIGKKKAQRWLWHAINHLTGAVLASVFGRRQEEVVVQLKGLWEPFEIIQYYTEQWGVYTRHLEPEMPSPGKRNTQKIESRSASVDWWVS